MHLKGELIQCQKCGEHANNSTLIHSFMNNNASNDPNNKLANFKFPLSKERSDIFSMRTAYDVKKLTNDDEKILKTINNLKSQEHTWEHHDSCFKKGPECRFHF